MSPVSYVNVGTSATLVATFSGTSNQTMRIHVDANAPMVFFGPNSSVTTGNGLPAGGGSDLILQRGFSGSPGASSAVYAITAATSANVTWTVNSS